jgi:hypothetical protein
LNIELPNDGWEPRLDQFPAWDYLSKGGKRACLVWHRRAGKDDVALHFTACASQRRVGNYWHMLPKYTQCRKAIWEAVNPKTGKRRIDEAFPQEIREQTKDQEMFIRFNNGSTWQLVGSDTFDTLVGSPPIGIVFSEYALADPRAWVYLSPILAENDGWAIFIFTPRGHNHGERLFNFASADKGWFAQKLSATQTEVFSKATLEQQQKELVDTYGPNEGQMLYEQEYGVSFEGFVYGAYFARQIALARKDGRICSVPWTSGVEVETAWDLGWDDSTTIWFYQVVGREIRFIDYYENCGYGLEHYAQVLKSKPYTYGNHLEPHDIAVHSLSTGKSRKETLENLGIKPIVIVDRPNNKDAKRNQIEAARNIISRCWFDLERCGPQGIAGLEAYHAEYNEEKHKLSDEPEHDWSSHGADAWRTFAVGYEDKVKVQIPDMISRRSRSSVGGSTGWMGN